MNENLNQSEQDNTENSKAFPSTSGPLGSQDPVPSADSPYEETQVPYLPLPSDNEQPTSPSPGTDDSQGADTSSSSLPTYTAATSPGIGGVGVLIGIVLGAILGGVFGHFTGGSAVIWAGIGAVVGGVIALLPSVLGEESVPWLFSEGLSVGLDGLFDCCLTSAIFVVATVVMISGLLFWHSLLLVAVAGGSIMTMLLIGLSFALLNHFLANG